MLLPKSLFEDKNLLTVLQELGGYYQCPQDAEGNRIGPLVGYAGKYPTGVGDETKQYVGDVYVNMAMLEENPVALRFFVMQAAVRILNAGGYPVEPVQAPTVYCGAPMGGITFGALLAEEMIARFVFPEKRVTSVATSESREQSILEFSRHLIRPGDRVAIVEDVVNNFSTTKQLVELIERQGGTVVAIICLLNRSELTSYEVVGPNIAFGIPDGELPIISIEHQPFKQYRQDDPAVITDVEAGNIVWKPKIEWERLQAAMAPRS